MFGMSLDQTINISNFSDSFILKSGIRPLNVKKIAKMVKSPVWTSNIPVLGAGHFKWKQIYLWVQQDKIDKSRLRHFKCWRFQEIWHGTCL